MADKSQHHSVSVRKIDNGYVMTRTHAQGDSYAVEERYLASQPEVNVQVGEQREPKPQGKALGTAVKLLKSGC